MRPGWGCGWALGGLDIMGGGGPRLGGIIPDGTLLGGGRIGPFLGGGTDETRGGSWAAAAGGVEPRGFVRFVVLT